MSEYKLYNLSDLKKNRYDIVQNRLLPVHSQTLTNERKATELLIEDLSDKIISEIILKINDL